MLLGRYEVLSQLGQGGTSRVYRAIQHPLERQVALKLVRPDLDEDLRLEFEQRFLREAALAGRLSHPAVVTVHDFGRTEDGDCFLVMELLRGRSLRRMLRTAPIEPVTAARIAAEIARGLHHAHVRGLVHRDVKPGNIFLVADDEGIERARLLDFGLVKEGTQSSISGVGSFLGTPHYIAPEQAKGLEDLDHRADIYSLGVVLYRMLCGQLPFTADNPMAIAIKHLREPVPRMIERAPKVRVAPELEDIVRRCLAKEPEQRFETAQELAEVLEAWVVSVSPQRTPAHPPDQIPAAPGPPARPNKGVSGLLLVVAGLGGLLILGQAGWRLLRPEPIPETPAVVEVLPEPSVPAPQDSVPPVPEPAQQPDPEPEPPELEEPGPPQPVLVDAGVAEVVRAPAEAEEVRPGSATTTPPPPPRNPTPTHSPEPEPAAEDTLMFVDGVAMSSGQAQALLVWVNGATEQELRAAGIYSRGVNVLLEKRPFGTVQELAATPYVGEKSIRAALEAVE